MGRALILIVAAVCADAFAGDLSELEATLVREANDSANRSVTGGLHCPKRLPGSFVEHTDQALRLIKGAARVWWDADGYEKALEVSDAIPAFTPVPRTAASETFFAEVGSASRQVREALCAVDGSVPPHFTVVGMWVEEAPYDHFTIAKALMVGLYEAQAAGSLDAQALRNLCFEPLAAARLVAPHGLIGRMVAISLVRQGFETCRRAILAAPSEADLLRLAVVLRALSERPPFAQVVSDERVFGQLGMFHDNLSKEARSRLPAGSETLIAWARKTNLFEERPFAASARQFLFGGWARRKHFDHLSEAIEATRLPPSEAAAKLDALAAEVPMAMSLIGSDGPPGGDNLGNFLRRDAEGRATLRMLVMAAELRAHRVRTGSWPASLREVVTVRDVALEPAILFESSAQGRQLRINGAFSPENPPPVFHLGQ